MHKTPQPQPDTTKKETNNQTTPKTPTRKKTYTKPPQPHKTRNQNGSDGMRIHMSEKVLDFEVIE
jgi:hypothetical protein